MDREQRLDEVITEHLKALEAGQPIDEKAWLLAHADIADELRAFLAGQRSIERIAVPLRATPTRPQTNLDNVPTVAPGQNLTEAPLGTVRYFGDYELLEEIARGGMGVVYKARQRSLDRVVALKMILAGQLAGEAEVQRFRHEAQLAAKLQHPGIVALHEVGEHEGQHFFSMDYIEGRSLADLVRQHPLPAGQAVRYVRLIAEAVHFAHQLGVLHRDLKPSNVLIDGFDQPRVTDFGLAKNIEKDGKLTATGAVLGTPSYMPPEQASGARGQVGPRSDVYALGAVLYELVTGRPPFQAVTPLDTILQVLHAEPAAPRLLNPAISRNLETVILKCLHKDPGKRYASAQDLAEDLASILEGRPIKARPPSLPERLGIWLKKQGRSFRVAATTVVTAALVLLAVWTILEVLRIASQGAAGFQTNGELLLVEIFADSEFQPVVPPFAAPNVHRVRLPEGAYRARLSAPYRLSETLPLTVERWTLTVTQVDLSKGVLGDPLPSSGVFGFMPRGAGNDVLSVVSKDALSRYHGVTGELLWTATLGPDGRTAAPGPPLPQAPPGTRLWGGGIAMPSSSGGFFLPEGWLPLLVGEQAPQLVRPWHDLDGDGEPDVIVANCHSDMARPGGELAALSGKDGKTLWLFRPTPMPPPGQAARAGPSYRVGPALSFPAARQADPPRALALYTSSPFGNGVWWAEAIDARKGMSLWQRRLDTPPDPALFLERDEGATGPRSAGDRRFAHGPWVEMVAGRPVFVCLPESKLFGVDVATGQPAWAPIDLGFKPIGSPAWAHQGQDLALVLRGPDKQTLRAISVPAGKVLWTHALPAECGWIGRNPGTGFLTEALPIDLDGNGKVEVIVPDEQGAIAAVDGASGKVLWRSSLGINKGTPSAACVHVGPDLDGDGCRDLFVANVVNEHLGFLEFGLPEYGHYLRFQAVSGKTGTPLWRSRFRSPGDLDTRELAFGMPLVSWQKGRDGWPLLVIPGDRQTLVVEASTGHIAHVIDSVRGPYHAVDLDGDGIPELVGLQFALESFGWRERVHRFRGFALDAEPEPVQRHDEAKEWVSYPLGIFVVLGYDLFLAPDFPAFFATTMLPLTLVFLGYVGCRLLRKGWSGLWAPAIAFLVLVLGLAGLFVVMRPQLEPWQQYSWAVWYWIFLAALFLAGGLTLMWLAIVGVSRLGLLVARACRRVFRRLAAANLVIPRG